MPSGVPLIVCGAAGRMGRRILALAAEAPDLCIVGAVEAAASDVIGRDAGEVAGVGPVGVTVQTELAPLAAPGHVILEFTTPEASMAHARAAADSGASIVIGTSGLSREERAEVAGLAERIPVILAANTSLGVNVLMSLVEDAVRRLGDGFDCEIVELHHNRKKDAPSGTAIALAEAAAAATGRDPEKDLVLARQGMVGERRPGEIGVVALRGGDNVGEHTVLLVGQGERVELVHRMASRDCLAAGAIRAARWLAGKPAGFYSMQDVIR